MDNTASSPTPAESPRPARPDLDSWRGDMRERPPHWRRRPKAEHIRSLWNATRPVLAQLGEGRSWR